MSLALSPQIIAIPQPDADGYWHYTYITHHPDTGEWYAGKHSTPNLDDGYIGSGNWIREHPSPAELTMEVIEFFYSEDHAYAAEAVLVNLAIIDADPLCRNETEGGWGFKRKDIARFKADPEYQRKLREAMARLWADPEFKRKASERMIRQRADPEFQRKVHESNTRLAADPDWLLKIRAVGARNSADPEWRRKLSQSNARLAVDPVWLQKNREVGARNSADPGWRQKISAAAARRNSDPEYRQKNLAVGARNSANPEWRRKISEGRRRYFARLQAERTASAAEITA